MAAATALTVFEAGIVHVHVAADAIDDALDGAAADDASSSQANMSELFGSGTLVASLGADIGSLLHLVALGHCHIPPPPPTARPSSPSSEQPRGASPPRTGSGAGRNSNARSASPASANSNGRAQSPGSAGTRRAQSAQQQQQPTDSSLGGANASDTHCVGDAVDASLFSSTRGVYAHVQRAARVTLGLPSAHSQGQQEPHFTSTFLPSLNASAFAMSSPSLFHRETIGNALLQSSAPSGPPRFCDLDLTFASCEAAAQSLPILGFCPSRVTRVECVDEEEAASEGEGPPSASRGEVAGGDDDDGDAPAVVVTSRAPRRRVARVVMDPARWFCASLTLAVAPPRNRQASTGSALAAFESPAFTIGRAAAARGGDGHQQPTSPFGSGNISSTTRRKPGGGGGGATVTAAAGGGANNPADLRGGMAQLRSDDLLAGYAGGGGNNNATTGATNNNAAALAAFYTTAAAATHFVKTMAELDAIGGGTYADESLCELWVLSQSVRLPDSEFRSLTPAAVARHAITLEDAFLFLSGLAEVQPYILDRSLSLEQHLRNNNFDCDSSNNGGVDGGGGGGDDDRPLGPTLLRRKVQEFVSAVDLLESSLAGSDVLGALRAAKRRASSIRLGESGSLLAGGGADGPMSPLSPLVGNAAATPDQVPSFGARRRSHAAAATFVVEAATTPSSTVTNTIGSSTSTDRRQTQHPQAETEEGLSEVPAAARRVTPNIAMLALPLPRVELVSPFLDRFVIDEVLNARRVAALSVRLQQQKLQQQHGNSNSATPSAAVFNAGGAAAAATAAAAAAATAPPRAGAAGANTNRRQRRSVLSLASSADCGDGAGPNADHDNDTDAGGGTPSHQQHDNYFLSPAVTIDELRAPIANPTAHQRQQFVTDVRGLGRMEVLRLAAAPGFVTLLDVVAVAQHATETGIPASSRCGRFTGSSS